MNRSITDLAVSALKVLTIAVAPMLALTVPDARAVGIVFGTLDTPNASDGNIVYQGGPVPMFSGIVGVPAIQIDFVFGLNTPLNSGEANQLACVACTFSFTTGNRLNSPSLLFDGGGSIVINGTVPGAGITIPQDLLSGQFTSPVTVVTSNIGNFTGVAAGAALDTKNQQLASYFGLPGGPTTQWSGSFIMGLQGFESNNGAFAAEISGAALVPILGGNGSVGGYFVNQLPVPEPHVWMMMAVGLGIVMLQLNRRRQAGMPLLAPPIRSS